MSIDADVRALVQLAMALRCLTAGSLLSCCVQVLLVNDFDPYTLGAALRDMPRKLPLSTGCAIALCSSVGAVAHRLCVRNEQMIATCFAWHTTTSNAQRPSSSNAVREITCVLVVCPWGCTTPHHHTCC